jgi:4-hydroxybenzoyl-CoA thioesterase/acyl-CoA thioester hydrolase
MGTPYRTRRMVEFHDTDMAGIMHFSAFFQYMEMAEHELLRSLGFSVYSTAGGEHISFPRVAASCDYHAPARCEDVLEIEVRVERVGEKSITYDFRFSLDGRDVATGSMTSVCCHVEPGSPPRSTKIPAEMAEKLRLHMAD